MGAPRFRPNLDTMEDRLTPATVDVSTALTFVQASNDELVTIWDHRGDPKTARSLEYHKLYLQQITAANLTMAQSISDWGSSLSTLAAADSGQASSLAPYIDQANVMSQMAMSNAAYAQTLAVGFGVDPSSFLPPPPPAPTPLSTTDASGMSRTIPDLNSPNWVSQANGLRIWDVVEGTGTAFTATDTAAPVYYIGWLTDGSSFDSNIDSGTPFEANLVSGVIQGWIQGIPGLKPGGIRRLDIPAELAYGEAGQGSIPPNARLIFEVKAVESTSTTDTSSIDLSSLLSSS